MEQNTNEELTVFLLVSPEILKVSNAEFFRCIDRFWSEDYGDKDLLINDEKYLSLLKTFDKPERKLSAMGYYRLTNQKNCVVIYDDDFFKKTMSILIVADTEIDFSAEDPIQDTIDRSQCFTQRDLRGN